jgi:hypothetical protein
MVKIKLRGFKMFLTEFEVLNKPFRVESTTHAYERMEERNIKKEIVISVIRGLRLKVLLYNNTGEEIALIDKQNDIAIILEVRLNKIVIITVIDRANIHIKDGTKLEEIA